MERAMGLEAQVHTHERRRTGVGSKEEWSQRPLRVSRVMQVFRDISVRTRMIWDDEASAPYLQRKHYLLAKTGFATVSECEECEESEGKPVPESIFRKIREAHEHA